MNTVLTTKESIRLACATLDIFSAIGVDAFGSREEAEDVVCSEMIDYVLTADRIKQFAADPYKTELSEIWQLACEIDYDSSKAAVLYELKKR